MRLLARAPLGVASLLAATCSGNVEPEVTISGVSPATAYNDEEVAVVIRGGPFRPVYDIDTGEGRATSQLGDFTAFLTPKSGSGAQVAIGSLRWVSPSELGAVLPKTVARGVYDVEVRDPRSRLARLEDGFESLGPDTVDPIVTISQPPAGTIVIGGSEVPVALHASDGAGRLTEVRWTVSWGDNVNPSEFCSLGLDRDVTCRFSFVAPRPMQPGQPLNINVSAKDSRDNVGLTVTTLSLGVTPVITTVAPREGPATGGTEIIVTGANFITGTKLLIGGVPAMLTGAGLDGTTTLRGRAPPHEPGFVPVAVRAGSVDVASGSFLYVGRPIVRAVSPSQGPVTGGTPVAIAGNYFREGATRIVFGTSDHVSEADLVCPKFVSVNRIEGYAPPGVGALSVYARDPVAGESQCPLAFTYLDDDSPDGAPPLAPPCQRGDGGTP